MEQTYMTKAIIEIHPELHRFALKLTANQDAANDLVQDSILKALDNADSYVRHDNFKGWMYTIMHNIFVNNYWRTKRELYIFDAGFEEYFNQTQTVREERTVNAHDREFMYKVINDLPDNMKKPFILSVFGLKYKEIAEKLDLPIGTIKSRLHFAKKKLQVDLKEFS